MNKETTMVLPLYCLYRENNPQIIQIDSDVLSSIVEQLSQNSETEQGGFLGIDSRGVIRGFWYDWDAQRDATGYRPSRECLTEAIGKWRLEGMSFTGIIHTHSSAMPKLSRSDLVYTQRLLEGNPNIKRLIMGLLVEGCIQMYLFERDFIPWLSHKLKHNEPLYRSQM